MFANLTSGLDIHAKALVLRAERQRVIASNIANADTPGYVARDIKFKEALIASTQTSSSELGQGTNRLQFNQATATTHAAHIAVPSAINSQLGGTGTPAYTIQSQPSVDGNSVDLDRERASFVDNSVRYESTLRFINGQSKTILSAIQGQ
jgi:flagellar basal-body rod protein FlgB